MDKHILNLCTALKQFRTVSGLTQKQIADKMGIKYQSYQAYEMGISVPTLQNLLKLCKIYDTTPDELLGF